MKKSSGRVVNVNGCFVDEIDAKVSIYDSALMFGDMVFEMTRSFNKKQFKLREHLERLFESVRYTCIPLQMTIDELEDRCYETIEKNDLVFSEDDEHRLMINISRGPLSLYAPVFDNKIEPTVIIADFPLKWTVASMAPLFDTGINAVIPSQRAIPASLLEPKVKNRSRLHYMMANIEVSQCKAENSWALLVDPDGFITEGTGDNFFIVKDNIIYTPEPRNILRGISRDYIFELANQLNLECIEKNIEPFDVMMADEAFMTATPFCILPVSSLNSRRIGTNNMGRVTRSLLNKWSLNVGLDIEKQIKDYAAEIEATAVTAPSPYRFESIET
ncbi:MAG: aminotransferase class IV [Coxiellaceae bacterium]|nr:aminotransferase class IV [Coxiellaceae bacterium]MDF1865536.1 aminotransferase class IV [Saprospiraceae bacterium]